MSTQDARGKIDALIQRMKSDARFQQQIQSDPSGALIAAGLFPDAIGDVLLDSDLEIVAGGMACSPRTTTDNCSCNCEGASMVMN